MHFGGPCLPFYGCRIVVQGLNPKQAINLTTPAEIENARRGATQARVQPCQGGRQIYFSIESPSRRVIASEARNFLPDAVEMRLLCYLAALSCFLPSAWAEGPHNLTSDQIVSLLMTMPECGRSCLLTAIAASPCQANNLTCTCESKELNDNTTACVTASCSVKNQLTTKNVSDTLCQAPFRDRRPKNRILVLSGLGVASIAFLLRICSKINFSRSANGGWSTTLWWDDAVIIGAFVLICGFDSLGFPSMDAGLGTDVWTIEFPNITRVLKVAFWAEDVYLIAIPALKISLVLTYLRIFQSRRFRQACFVVIGLNISYGIVFVVISVFQCQPISCAWTRWSGEYPCKCNNINAQGWCSAAINVMIDFVTIGVPLPQLWAMNMNWRKKSWVMLMFCVGFVVTGFSIIRLQVLIKFGKAKNFTWEYMPLAYWTAMELHLAVVCACMPAIRNLLRRYNPRLMGASTNAGSVEWISRNKQSTNRSANSKRKSGTIDSEQGVESDHEQIIALQPYETKSAAATREEISITPPASPQSVQRKEGLGRKFSLPRDYPHAHSTTLTISNAGDTAEQSKEWL
ncbi:hypothetical protein BST61_g9557 [Cercospora zeina]